jgi:hypothetical protein
LEPATAQEGLLAFIGADLASFEVESPTTSAAKTIVISPGDCELKNLVLL